MIGAFQAGALASAKPPVSPAHRYWRLKATDISWTTYWDSSGAGTIALWELRLFSSTDGSGSNLALNKSASTSSYYGTGYEGSKAVDGNLSTRWTTLIIDTFQWISIDLTTPVEIHSLSLRSLAYQGQCHPKTADIQWSDDNSNWTTLVNKSLPNVTTEILLTNL
jgi:hypothetical protein